LVDVDDHEVYPVPGEIGWNISLEEEAVKQSHLVKDRTEQ